jgi:hypothetical protein
MTNKMVGANKTKANNLAGCKKLYLNAPNHPCLIETTPVIITIQ